MKVRAEVGIVGAGPAGARAAELLAGLGAEVIMFDPRAPWEKPCGGGLTVSAFDSIPDLAGVMTLARRIDTVRIDAEHTTVTVPLQRSLYVLSRTELARWQLERAETAGAHFERTSVRGIRRTADNGWDLDLASGGSATVVLLVGADGAASRVRTTVAHQLDIELAPTRVAFVPGAGPTPLQIGLRFFADAQGYAWDFPRPDHRSIGIGVAPGTWARPRLDAEVDHYCDLLGHCEYVDAARAGAVIGTAARRMDRRYSLVGQSDYALLGDAAGFADPATGEGIQNAIRSADFLAEAYARDRRFTAYSRIAHDHFEAEFRASRQVRRLLYAGNLTNELIEFAARSNSWYAVLTAMVDGGNAHDPLLLRKLLQSWWRARRAV